MSTKENMIDKNSDKYKVLLKLVNNILSNIGKEKIVEVTEFQNIDRDDIIKEVNITTFRAIEKELFEYYDKYKCGYYKKSNAYVLNCLRGLVKELGYKLIYTRKELGQIIDGKSLRRTHTFYSIK